MLKIYCDVCGQEPNNQDFVFEAQIKEIVQAINMGSKDFNTRPQLKTSLLQICKKCYNDKIEPLLLANEKNK